MKYFLSFLVLPVVFLSGKCNAQQLPEEIQWGVKKNAFTSVPPPSVFTYRNTLHKTVTSNFQIQYNSPSPPVEAQWAIEYAVNIWEHLLNTPVSQTINIYVEWMDLGSDLSSVPLAQCGPDTFYNSPLLPNPETQ